MQRQKALLTIPSPDLGVANEPSKNGNKVDKVASGQGPAKEDAGHGAQRGIVSPTPHYLDGQDGIAIVFRSRCCIVGISHALPCPVPYYLPCQ